MPSHSKESESYSLINTHTYKNHFSSIGWMLLASLLFSLVSVAIRLSKPYFFLSEIMFYRNILTVFILATAMPFLGKSLRTKHKRSQWQRATLGSIAMILNFYANLHLPISLAMTLSYTNPIFLAMIVSLWHGKKLSPSLISCITIGSLGVIILLHPSTNTPLNVLGILAGLGAGFFAACSYLNIQTLSQQGEPEWRTVFYFALYGSLYSALSNMIFNTYFHSLSLHHIWLILSLGIAGILGQWCITRAFSLGNPNVISVFSYFTLLFSGFFGFLFFQEIFGLLSLIGTMVIIASGLFAMKLKNQD